MRKFTKKASEVDEANNDSIDSLIFPYGFSCEREGIAVSGADLNKRAVVDEWTGEERRRLSVE
jgi:hypothetical protein